MLDLDSIQLTPKQIRTTIVFLITFLVMIGYGILTKQGTNYALIVMIVLAIVLTLVSWINVDVAMKAITIRSYHEMYAVPIYQLKP